MTIRLDLSPDELLSTTRAVRAPARVPVMLIPCIQGRVGGIQGPMGQLAQASIYTRGIDFERAPRSRSLDRVLRVDSW